MLVEKRGEAAFFPTSGLCRPDRLRCRRLRCVLRRALTARVLAGRSPSSTQAHVDTALADLVDRSSDARAAVDVAGGPRIPSRLIRDVAVQQARKSVRRPSKAFAEGCGARTTSHRDDLSSTRRARFLAEPRSCPRRAPAEPRRAGIRAGARSRRGQFVGAPPCSARSAGAQPPSGSAPSGLVPGSSRAPRDGGGASRREAGDRT
jgi:hypothetical protein